MISLERAIENLKFSIHRYKENLFPLVLGALLSLFITLLVASVAIVMILSIPFTSSFLVDINTNLALYMTNIIVAVIFLILAWLVSIALSAGQIGMAHQALTEKASINTLFSVAKSRGLTAIAASILYSIIVLIPISIPLLVLMLSLTNPSMALIGYLLFVILIFVSIFLSIRLSLFMQAIVVSRVSAIESLKTSNAVVKVYWWDLIVLCIIYGLIVFALNLIHLVGSLITSIIIFPLMWVSLVKFYVDRTTTVPTSSQKTKETPSRT